MCNVCLTAMNVLKSFISGSKSRFIVRTAGSGSGFLAVFIDGPAKTALSCREVDEGYEFSYVPVCPGKYLITVKYGNIDIAGSPYQATVTGILFVLILYMHYENTPMQYREIFKVVKNENFP